MLVWFARLILLLVAEKLLGPALKQESMLLKSESAHSIFDRLKLGIGRIKISPSFPNERAQITKIVIYLVI